MKNSKTKEIVEMDAYLSLSHVKAFIKSKWRNEGLKLVKISGDDAHGYHLKFEKRKMYSRKNKTYSGKSETDDISWI